MHSHASRAEVRPATALTGDVLIASIDIRSAAVIGAPAGWTQVINAVRTSPFKHTKATYWHLVGAGDPAAYDFTFSAPSSPAAILLAYGGVDDATPIDAWSSRVNTGNTDKVNATDVTTTVNGTMLVGLFSIAVSTSFEAPPTGMTERAQVAQAAGGTTLRVTAEAVDQLWPTAGPTGPLVRTADAVANGYGIGQLIALKPAP